MPKFELGFALRGSTAPEVKQVVEASSMRQAMLNIIDQHGGDDVVLVTHAHPFKVPEVPRPCSECGIESSGGAPSEGLKANAPHVCFPPKADVR